ncbi:MULTISPECIES: protoporphyrinogen oxidase HemJ [Gluconacetobacter]|uniref:Protoporphyrinogen IX oxidase n=2 Tax=Gluconacetobacter TaxID=89583 RepID=A0A7W4P9Y7_9PROT|nr:MULTISPECIES: protoporphyrinogen oxidase HemJ [Gluconacetobacter]MBB2171265.1 protoporphyrinogen oxidase HemJ [Gluconacetobacter asukensis]MBB2179490.1 protoporphyrinogen oxidase HemJ [Gluconacetobacter tumulicola]
MILGFLPWLAWFKALHVMSLIAWMSGMFYLPRLFVYHCQAAPGSAESARFKVMERKLLRQIMNPAMISTFLFGTLLVLTPGTVDWHAGWWYLKIVSVLGLAGFHGACARWRRDFAEDRNTRPENFYRAANEIPTILMAVVVIMVIVRPF